VDRITDWLIAFVSRNDNPLGLAILAASAMIEYVVPPFPGDTVTLFGAVLITAYGWSWWAVLGAVLAGAAAGSMIAFVVGVRVQRRRELHPGRSPQRAARLDQLIRRFERHGAAYLLLNRFLPAFRALLFVAAGMARMPWRTVLLYSLVSAAVWNGMLVGAGALIGGEFDRLAAWVGRYTTAVWIGAGALVALLGARALWRRLRRRR
jgi:membrane protein DedA with SNARE-associated domain